jgi:hypothetical protein
MSNRSACALDDAPWPNGSGFITSRKTDRCLYDGARQRGQFVGYSLQQQAWRPRQCVNGCKLPPFRRGFTFGERAAFLAEPAKLRDAAESSLRGPSPNPQDRGRVPVRAVPLPSVLRVRRNNHDGSTAVPRFSFEVLRPRCLRIEPAHCQYARVRREGITEAAGKVQSPGLIHYSRGHITVIDRPRLEAWAC